jgi:aspartate carbamoyltransferase catalytic subunit
MTTVLKGKDILHVKDLKLEQVSLILETASRFERCWPQAGR